MNLKCNRCDKNFDNATFLGYCNDCLAFFTSVRDRIHAAQRPATGVYADGKFADPKDQPHSVYDPVARQNVCGLCGSPEIESGYGLGTGYGIGVYNFCMSCEHFLDFCEDMGD